MGFIRISALSQIRRVSCSAKRSCERSSPIRLCPVCRRSRHMWGAKRLTASEASIMNCTSVRPRAPKAVTLPLCSGSSALAEGSRPVRANGAAKRRLASVASGCEDWGSSAWCTITRPRLRPSPRPGRNFNLLKFWPEGAIAERSLLSGAVWGLSRRPLHCQLSA